MQVDGEACKLAPSIIKLSLLNQATMLAKRRGGKAAVMQSDQITPMKLSVNRICMSDYEQHHYDKELLSQAAQPVDQIEVSPAADLEQVIPNPNISITINSYNNQFHYLFMIFL